MYKQTYYATTNAARAVMRLKLCDRPECATCSIIKFIKENLNVAACLKTERYSKEKLFPVEVLTGDAHGGHRWTGQAYPGYSS